MKALIIFALAVTPFLFARALVVGESGSPVTSDGQYSTTTPESNGCAAEDIYNGNTGKTSLIQIVDDKDDAGKTMGISGQKK